MQWKLFWVMFGASLSIAGAVIPTMLELVWWGSAAVVGIIGIVMLSVTGFIIHTADMFAALLYSQREKIVRLCRLAVLAYTVWAVVYIMRPELWTWMLTVLVILGVGIYWGCRAGEYWLKHSKPAPETKPETDTTFEDLDMVKKFRPVLNRAGFDSVHIIGHEAVKDEQSHTTANQFIVQVPASGR